MEVMLMMFSNAFQWLLHRSDCYSYSLAWEVVGHHVIALIVAILNTELFVTVTIILFMHRLRLWIARLLYKWDLLKWRWLLAVEAYRGHLKRSSTVWFAVKIRRSLRSCGYLEVWPSPYSVFTIVLDSLTKMVVWIIFVSSIKLALGRYVVPEFGYCRFSGDKVV